MIKTKLPESLVQFALFETARMQVHLCLAAVVYENYFCCFAAQIG